MALCVKWNIAWGLHLLKLEDFVKSFTDKYEKTLDNLGALMEQDRKECLNIK